MSISIQIRTCCTSDIHTVWDGFDGSQNIRASIILTYFVLFSWLWHYNLSKMNGLSFSWYPLTSAENLQILSALFLSCQKTCYLLCTIEQWKNVYIFIFNAIFIWNWHSNFSNGVLSKQPKKNYQTKHNTSTQRGCHS